MKIKAVFMDGPYEGEERTITVNGGLIPGSLRLFPVAGSFKKEGKAEDIVKLIKTFVMEVYARVGSLSPSGCVYYNYQGRSKPQ